MNSNNRFFKFNVILFRVKQLRKGAKPYIDLIKFQINPKEYYQIAEKEYEHNYLGHIYEN